MTVPVDSSVPTKVLFTDHTLLVSSSIFFFYYWWLQLWDFTQKLSQNDDFLLFPIVYSKINMLLRKFRLGNNLPTHIKENTNFLRQKPRQLPSAEAVFERCYFRKWQVKCPNNPLSFTALAVLTIIL